ncbi:WD repeat-containing protein 13-like [Salvia splendens]|uniref:WD repeat-containing protein 13-like n=1 Tax=Salvia splendens TaxID=180675 RepID=UPI001C2572EF|nr:WD repeat-containing protein 13-like [Salvia splendens]
MADPTIGGISTEGEKAKSQNGEKKKEDLDPEFLSCLLQPSPPDSDPNYIGIRRLLLHRKAQAGQLNRKGWKCNERGYVAFRNFINRPRNWESNQTPSLSSTPGQSGRWLQSPSSLFPVHDADSWSTGRDLRSSSRRLSRTTSLSSITSETEHPRKKVEPAYSFVGMHCIFDQAKAMVTVIKFGNMSSDLLAYGSADGILTVCNVSIPPTVLQQLTGHTKDVTDFDFSANNQYIASASIDKTVRVWDISKGLCIRVIYGVSSQLCIRFHPVNNNFLSAGNANKEILVFNFSTGRTINKMALYSEVTAMDHDHTGQIIFCGDAQGCVYTLTMDSHTGALSRTHRHRSKANNPSPITTVQYRTFSLLARGPVLLTFSRDGSLSFFSVSLELQGYLTVRCALKLTPRLHSIRASFCPLLSLQKGEYIVAGSEDTNVYFYDLTRPKHACVNKLQGHGYPVIGIAWNHGENFLASSDFGGTVIVWKREKTK